MSNFSRGPLRALLCGAAAALCVGCPSAERANSAGDAEVDASEGDAAAAAPDGTVEPGPFSLRLVHASPDSGAVDIYFVPAGTLVDADTPKSADALALGEVWGFDEMSPAAYALFVYPAAAVPGVDEPVYTALAGYSGDLEIIAALVDDLPTDVDTMPNLFVLGSVPAPTSDGDASLFVSQLAPDQEIVALYNVVGEASDPLSNDFTLGARISLSVAPTSYVLGIDSDGLDDENYAALFEVTVASGELIHALLIDDGGLKLLLYAQGATETAATLLPL